MVGDWRRTVRERLRDRWPELVVGLLTCLIFLGCLDSLELWGKREQRASAEALDTVDSGHWLVAEIQGRPRLEKPPLPRWIIATLMMLTSRRDEFIVRLPNAIAGIATVAFVYAMGRGMGGRRLGLASAMILATSGLFISELRQAGNDGLLTLFTAMAIHAAWRRIHGTSRGAERGSPRWESIAPGPRSWALAFYAALGLGFLCKGPVILWITAITLVPYLLVVGRFREGMRSLAHLGGLALFIGLALCWPLPVLLGDPRAIGVWMTEIGQKTGVLPIGHQERAVLGLSLPAMLMPWTVVGLVGALLPVLAWRPVRLPWRRSTPWFPWFWAMGNLATFSFWAVAKPNYFVPCLPGMALLAGMGWIRLSKRADARAVAAGVPPRSHRVARILLGLQWLLILAVGVAGPLLSRRNQIPAPWPWVSLIMLATLGGVVASIAAWRRRREVLALIPLTAAATVAVLVGYGAIARLENPSRGHQTLARQLQDVLPADLSTVRFFHEIDEGLWFYLKGRRLAPVPGSQPRYSNSYDRMDLILGSSARGDAESPRLSFAKQHARNLIDWLRREDNAEPYFLIRASFYQQMAEDLEGWVTPIYQESGRRRNTLMLLRLRDDAPARIAESEIFAPIRR